MKGNMVYMFAMNYEIGINKGCSYCFPCIFVIIHNDGVSCMICYDLSLFLLIFHPLITFC